MQSSLDFISGMQNDQGGKSERSAPVMNYNCDGDTRLQKVDGLELPIPDHSVSTLSIQSAMYNTSSNSRTGSSNSTNSSAGSFPFAHGMPLGGGGYSPIPMNLNHHQPVNQQQQQLPAHQSNSKVLKTEPPLMHQPPINHTQVNAHQSQPPPQVQLNLKPHQSNSKGLPPENAIIHQQIPDPVVIIDHHAQPLPPQLPLTPSKPHQSNSKGLLLPETVMIQPPPIVPPVQFAHQIPQVPLTPKPLPNVSCFFRTVPDPIHTTRICFRHYITIQLNDENNMQS